ncbi:branched-chain-amino-acid transaminase [Ruficoccus amylovorans]|uniref:Branched-chain-amino-acid aminotransferase n=1 Tax=Ruficoccus amylovorans TaxID=1804625 RepID=A0A842HLG8_9BACT|nr:branched-chain-amino-acid transaminase [Ruficoccus amylovorans]MBC2596366.1 branched-chain-amino-acid transaminase [Ruficoccus amylovorans]
MKIYINGKFYGRDEAKVSVFDHGFLYGDGIFEGIRVYGSNVFELDEHLKRLEYSAKAIMLEMPWTRQEVSDAVCETCRQSGVTDGYIRLIVTRGAGALGLSPKTCHDPQLIIIADQIQLYAPEVYENGLKIITSATRRNSPAALPPMVKSLNYLNNILAKIEASNLGYQEAIMLNNEGYVAECTGDNIFVLQGGKLYTPPVSSGSLTGITRQVVVNIAAELGVPLVETALTRYDLWVAEEMFLTGSAAEIIGVVEVDHRKISNGKPGPVTGKFLQAFRERVTRDGTKL